MSPLTAITMCVVCGTGAAPFSKDYPPGQYPERFARLSVAQWPELKAIVDKILQPQPASAVSTDATDARYALTRIAQINWGPERGTTVSTYLRQVAQVLLGPKGRLLDTHGVDAETSPNARKSRVLVAESLMVSLLSIDEEAACERIREVWTICVRQPQDEYYLLLRQVSLRTMLGQWRKTAVAGCVQSVEEIAGEGLTPVETDIIRLIRLYGALGKLGGEGQAWQHLARMSESAGLDDVLTRETRYCWYRNMLAMKEVYGQLDPKMPYQLAAEASQGSSRYILTYCAAFAMNQVLGRNAVSDEQREVAKQILTLGEDVYRDARMGKVIKRDGSHDFLKLSLDAMRQNLRDGEKRSHVGGGGPSTNAAGERAGPRVPGPPRAPE